MGTIINWNGHALPVPAGLDRKLTIAKAFEAGSVIYLKVSETSINNMEVSGGFDVALLKNK